MINNKHNKLFLGTPLAIVFAVLCLLGSLTGCSNSGNGDGGISEIPTQVQMPNIIGLEESTALASLTALDLNTTVIRENRIVPIGEVVNQNPASGVFINEGSNVSVTVSLGVSVPDVSGMTQTLAIQSITDAGLNYSITLENNAAPIGEVASQSVDPLTNVDPGTSIELVVSLGISVPDVTFMNEADATTTLTDVGLSVTTIPMLNTMPIGQVFNQNPSQGSNVEAGSVVEISVSDGLIVPDVTGMNSGEASSLLESIGFSVQLNFVATVTQPDGEVFGQHPYAGVQTNGSVLVTLSVYLYRSGPTDCLTDTTNISLVNQINLLTNPADGGRLYDNWWTERGTTPPINDHPLWGNRISSALNTQSGSTTWRCKECHGWDYAGNEGVYGSTANTHYTGFPGILSAGSDSAINVFCKIKVGSNIDSRHNFSQQLDDGNILNLTRFVLEIQTGTMPRGMLDTTTHISSSGTIVGANHMNGDTLFNSPGVGCASSNCHGPNGDLQQQPLAELALVNPWETLHKIRFGHPGSSPLMPAYSDPNSGTPLTLSQSKDILAYAQVLTSSQQVACTNDFAGLVSQIDLADAAQGGQLYDTWWIAAGAQTPTDDHPLWISRASSVNNVTTGSDTWRCKECHGWDYAGVNGVYGNISSPHYTGFPGSLGTGSSAPIDVFCAIRSGTGINSAHNFTTVMSDIQILHLTKFVTAPQTGTMPLGMIDATSHISVTGEVLDASATNGEILYNSGSTGCAASNCHGASGDIQAQPLGILSTEDPWQTLHRVRFGHPGSIPQMPAYSEQIALVQSKDIIAFTQTLGSGGGGVPLPTIADVSIIALGGRLFDDWMAESGTPVPLADNPVWDLRARNSNGSYYNNRSGRDTWRCEECHGWDYKGVDGIYGDTSNAHYTGFGSLLNTQKTEQDIVNYLTIGFYYSPTGVIMHNFEGLLTVEEIQALAKFVKQGMVDTNPYFGLHKIRFGQPAATMPAMFSATDSNGNLIFNLQDSVDIIQYTQTLP